MTDPFAVHPEGLASVANSVGEVGSRHQAVAAQMGAQPTGYCAQTHGDMADHWAHWAGVCAAVAAQADFLKSHAEVLGHAARVFTAADEA
ncbi:hypothetical protein [Mycobacterium sp. SP-6446]|uniref:hypothetical protein n=1 Tax=Mycobacterium sp. SP-6446 TaxID=1834162 RepID=UPI0011156F9F|nr:hypothetical protein [Mycobacterium sp. SP-6446]